MIDVVEAIGNVGVEHIFGLFANDIENGCNRIMNRPTWAKTIAIRFKPCLPFGFQSQFCQALMGAIQHGWDSKWPLLSFSWFGYPDPSGWLRFDGFVVAQTFHHDEALGWFDGFHPVNASRSFALVVLCHPAYRQGTGCLGFHQEPLKALNRFVIATKRGLIDPFLQSVHFPL